MAMVAAPVASLLAHAGQYFTRHHDTLIQRRLALDITKMTELAQRQDPSPVRVVANDYDYDGWLVAAFQKRDGTWRCIVEDANKRLFIHSAGQLEQVK
jgi:hypothetical protein